MPGEATLWTDPPHTRHFIIPAEADLPAGDFALRTATGRTRSVDEAAVARFEVTEVEAKAWAQAQLRETLGEARGKVLDFASRLKSRAAEMREESRKALDEGVAGAPPELRDAVDKARSGLRDLGRAMQRIARENLDRTEADRTEAERPDRDPSANDADRRS